MSSITILRYVVIQGSHSSVPSTESALNTSRYYATHPHLAGTEEDFRDAKNVLSFFQREFGIAPSSTEPIFDAGSPESRMSTLSTTSTLEHPFAWVDVYYPVLNTGNADGISLSILGANDNPIWTADLLEDGDPLDNITVEYKYSIPPWHGLSAAGQAVGQLVYANYGTKDDYDKLIGTGVNLTSKIILARYGVNYRGLKVSEHGINRALRSATSPEPSRYKKLSNVVQLVSFYTMIHVTTVV